MPKRRAPGTGCQIPKCRQNKFTTLIIGERDRNLCPEHAADHLFGIVIRGALEGDCYARRAGIGESITCNGRIQCAHIIRRGYHAVRWDESNAVPLCAAHHLYWTHHPMEWEAVWGEHWDKLRYRALHEPPMDPKEVIARYTMDAEAAGIRHGERA